MQTLSCSLLTLAVGSALALTWFATDSQSAAQVAAGGAQDLEARVDGTVREAGTLTSANPLEFPCLVTGGTTILTIVPNGSYVLKGDLLVELDGSAIEEQVQKQLIAALQADANSQQAASQVEITKLQSVAELAETRVSLARQETSSALAEIELEIGSLEKQLVTLKKKSELVQNDEESRNIKALQYQLLLLDLGTEADIITAKLKHLKTRVLPIRQEQQTQQAKVAEQQLLLQKLKSESNRNQAQAVLEARKIVAGVEQQKHDELRRTLENCRIVAPRDGIVVYANQSSRRAEPVQIEEGATVRERQLLLHMPDLEHLQMNVRVHESKITQVKAGQSATIRFDALPDEKFQGTVTAIAETPLAGAWPNLDVKQYEVIVSLEKPDPKLKLGLTGVVEIDVTK